MRRRVPGCVPFRSTTATVQALYPFMAGPGLGADAPYVGQEVFGGAFCFDPWNLYAHGHITNPNILVAGQVGRGKSALVKSLVYRGLVFGRRAAVLDPKGEYGSLARAVGSEPITLRPGGPARLNPLDPGPGGDDVGADEVERRRLTLFQTVAEASLKRELRPIERAACRVALRRAASGEAAPTLPMLADALLRPDADAGAEIEVGAADLARASHDLALEVSRLCAGELRGMFDGETTVSVDWQGPLIVIDLSEVADDEGLSILMACATAWLQAAIARPDAGHRYVVIDEAWRLLNHVGTARWLRASLKLARQFGVANVGVIHRLSDLLAAGDEGSEQVQLAKGILSDTETRILYAQSENEVGKSGELLGLGVADQERLASLPRGVALWKVGRTTHLVRHDLSAAEAEIFDTDARMADGGGSGSSSRLLVQEG